MKARTTLGFGIHSIFWAALCADAALLAGDSILTGLVAGHSVWRPTWVVASVFMGKVVLHWPPVFDLAAITAAMTALFPFCFCYALLLALVVLPWSLNRPCLAGAAFGALCYFASGYGLAHWRPWLSGERGWILLVSHVALGLTATGVLLYRARRSCD